MLPRPFGKTLLVRVNAPATEKKVGELVVINAASEEPFVADVIAVGDIPGIEAGDRVGFSRYAGTVFDLDGVKHHHLQKADVLLVWARLATDVIEDMDRAMADVGAVVRELAIA